MRVVSYIEALQEDVVRRTLEHCGLWHGPPHRLPPPRPPPQRRRRPPPCEVQLLLDPEFTADLATVGQSVTGRHLVLDPEYLAECPGDTGTQQQGEP